MDTKEQPKASPDATLIAPEAVKLTMPGLEKGPASFFDTESGNYWIGIPTKSIDLFAAVLILDSEKWRLFERYHAIALEAQNKSKIVKPHWSEVGQKFKKAGQALGLIKV